MVVIGIIFAVVGKSAATLGLALENAVDIFSSSLVCWRFWGGGSTIPMEVLELREKKASIAIVRWVLTLERLHPCPCTCCCAPG